MSTQRFLYATCLFDPLVMVVCAAALAAYFLTYRARVSGGRAGFLAAAVVALMAALVSPIGGLAEGYLFSAHMLQHLLLLLVVPPLALLSVPEKEGTATLPARQGQASFAAAWIVGVAAMWLWHTPKLCDAAAQSALVHRVQEASLLLMGTMFWWPILAPRAASRLPPLGGIVYLFTACVACTVLGIAITFSPVEVCSVYLHPQDNLGILSLLRDRWGLTPEKDQQLGGLFMWVPACLVYGAGILGLFARFYRAPEADAVRGSPPEGVR
jgi:putative membrane protein